MRYEEDKLLSIVKPGAVCALCGQSLADEPKHLSALKKNHRKNGDAGGRGRRSAGVKDAPREDGAAPAQSVPSPAAPKADETAQEEPDFIRTDYHRDCWKKAREHDYLSFWLARRPAPPETPKMTRQERNTALLGLFSAIMNTSDPADDPVRFILSHLLMRYRVLRLAGSRRDEEAGRRWIVFENPKTEERHEIPDLRLSDEQAAQTLERINSYVERVRAEPRPETDAPSEAQ